MQPNQPGGGLRRPTRMPDPQQEEAPRRYRSQRPTADTSPQQAKEDPVLYDDFNTYYSRPRKQAKPRKKTHTVLWTIVFLITLMLEGCVLLLMAPQLFGITFGDITSLPTVAFANGSILTYDEATYESFARMRDSADTDRLHSGIVIDGIDVSGMTLTDARAALNAVEATGGGEFHLTIQVDGQTWSVTSDEIPMTRNTEEVLRLAYARGRTNSTGLRTTHVTPLLERYTDIVNLQKEGMTLTTHLTYDEEALRSKAEAIAAAMSSDPGNAAVTAFDFNTKKFSFSDEVNGKLLDADTLYDTILARLTSGETEGTIVMDTVTVLPSVTKAELMNNLVCVSTYTTTTTKNDNRNTNVRLSAEAINGVVVQPGETFSFNQATGQRTAEKGYKEANAISGGQSKPEVGGGVCQTSSTLFNAVARANL